MNDSSRPRTRAASGAAASMSTASPSVDSSRGRSPSSIPPAPSSGADLRTLAPLQFELTGETSLVMNTPGGSWIPARPDATCDVDTAEGIATRIDGSTLELTGARRVTLTHNLPSSIDLRMLLGQTLRVTLADEHAPHEAGSQTLSISGVHGRLWLIARSGPVHGVVHTMGAMEVRAALSQRHEGPLVVGTEKLQWLVAEGCHVRLRPSEFDLERELVVELIARGSGDSAAYVIAESALYVG